MLAQALNERLDDLYRSYRVPLSNAPLEVVEADLRAVVAELTLRPPHAPRRRLTRPAP